MNYSACCRRPDLGHRVNVNADECSKINQLPMIISDSCAGKLIQQRLWIGMCPLTFAGLIVVMSGNVLALLVEPNLGPIAH